MIDRGAGNDVNWDNSAGDINIVTDWIGVDTRSGNGGNGAWDGTTGTPTYITIALGGLSAGSYEWTSYHHDTEKMWGAFATWVSIDGGTTFTQLADGVMTNSTSGGNPAPAALVNGPDINTMSSIYEASFIANGADDVVIRFAPYSIVTVHRSFFLMNAFEIETLDLCNNSPPEVEGAQAMLTIVNRPTLVEVTVNDDGKPYLEGCDANFPDTGTPHGLQYQWSQQSGSGTSLFNPATADVKDISVVFPLQGVYELKLVVSDGPEDGSLTGGKTSEYLVTVEVFKPIVGDINLSGMVDLQDLEIMADQWLGDCSGHQYCSDLNDSGYVTMNDIAVFADHFMEQSQQIIINEFVASNKNSLLDGNGNSSDWIELYNKSITAVSLAGWYLTDDENNLMKWPFPQTTILTAGEYLILFASGQQTNDYIDSLGYMHTNFSLAASGEFLGVS